MKLKGLVCSIWVGCCIAFLTACGGGGGDSGGDEQTYGVPLPDISRALQKSLNTENSRQALTLALEVLELVEQSALDIEPATDTVRASVGRSGIVVKTLLRNNTHLAVVNASGMCISGSTQAEGNLPSEIGRRTYRFRSCATSEGLYDGTLIVDQRSYPANEGLTDATLTFKSLRISNSNEDFVLDGSLDLDATYVDGGTGHIAANLDIRDLKNSEGILVRDFAADFSVRRGESSYQYLINHRSGRIYDSSGEYVDVGVVPDAAPWPKLIGKNSTVTFAPSGHALPYRYRLVLSVGSPATQYVMLSEKLGSVPGTTNEYSPEFLIDVAGATREKNQTTTIPLFDAVDRDHHFVVVSWQVESMPERANPSLSVSPRGLSFSSAVGGDYRFLLTASDGARSTTTPYLVHVRYDVPVGVISGPANINDGGPISFSLDLLSSEGTVEIAPVTPGLSYDGNGILTYTPQIPDFGIDQAVNLVVRTSNEDHASLAEFPLTARSIIPRYPRVLPVESDYKPTTGVIGSFGASGELGVASSPHFSSALGIYTFSGASPSFESYVLFPEYASTSFSLLSTRAIADLDGNGTDELVVVQGVPGVNYDLLGIFDVSREQLMRHVQVPRGSEYFSAAQIADLDGDGTQEIVYLNGDSIFILDAQLNLLWQSPHGAYGRMLLLANTDADAELEIITDRGFVIDSEDHIVQHPGVADFSAETFFVGKTSNSDATSIYAISSDFNGVRTLYRLGDESYLPVQQHIDMRSNALSRNIDSDATEEIIFVGNFDATNPETPLNSSGRGELSLAYLDPNGDTFDVRLIKSLAPYSPGLFDLQFRDFDGDGDSEYLVLSTGNDRAAGSFIYHDAAQVAEDFTDLIATPTVLRSDIYGGTAATSLGNKLIFCGGYENDNGQDRDLLALDLQTNMLTTPISWKPSGGVTSGFVAGNHCFVATSPENSREYVVSIRSGYDPSAGSRVFNEVSVLAVPDGNMVFHRVFYPTGTVMPQEIWPYEVGDLDADGDLDLAYSYDQRHLQIFDIASGSELASFDTGTGIYIKKIVSGRRASFNSPAQIFLVASSQTIALQWTSGGDLYRSAATSGTLSVPVYGAYTADVAPNPGDELIVVTSESPTSNSDFRIYDTDLNKIAEWRAQSTVGVVKSLRGSNGLVVATTETQSDNLSNNDWRVIWREPMTGTVIYATPQINYAGDINGFEFFNDATNNSMRMVLTETYGVVITP